MNRRGFFKTLAAAIGGLFATRFGVGKPVDAADVMWHSPEPLGLSVNGWQVVNGTSLRIWINDVEVPPGTVSQIVLNTNMAYLDKDFSPFGTNGETIEYTFDCEVNKA
jgi:hypothetical protein